MESWRASVNGANSSMSPHLFHRFLPTSSNTLVNTAAVLIAAPLMPWHQQSEQGWEPGLNQNLSVITAEPVPAPD